MAGDGALYIGLMSGTSLDGIDAALVQCGPQDITLLATQAYPLPAAVRAQIAAICRSGADEIERLGRLDRELGELFAAAARQLLAEADVAPEAVTAIGSHGQTIRHAPPRDAQDHRAFSLQIGDPNTIVEETGIATVADFRRRDMACGGEGAPLAPAFHAAVFSRAERNRAIVNIGGIANVSLLQGKTLLAGFDTGPGNTLLDNWYARHRQGAYDAGGRWAGGGRPLPALLSELMTDPYFQRSGPRSTGREAFNASWLQRYLDGQPPATPQDVQATLVQVTAISIARGITSASPKVDEVFVCGGGAHNDQLMAQIAAQLAPVPVHSTAVIGMHPDWVEAAAFAWLAHRRMQALPGSAPAVTGARGPRVLGGIYLP